MKKEKGKAAALRASRKTTMNKYRNYFNEGYFESDNNLGGGGQGERKRRRSAKTLLLLKRLAPQGRGKGGVGVVVMEITNKLQPRVTHFSLPAL